MKKTLALTVVALFFVLPLMAQFGPPAPPSGAPCYGPFANPGVPCPIDGGVSILLAAGALYGAKRTRDLYKKS